VTNFVHDIQKQCKELHLSHKCHGVGGIQSAAHKGLYVIYVTLMTQ